MSLPEPSANNGWRSILKNIEANSINYVRPEERHGNVLAQGPFWFLQCLQFVTIAVGFIGPGMGLSFLDTAISGTLGILFGTVFMALHATQGPDLGLPQMIQSRAQFGFKGIVLPLFGTAFTFVGFNVVSIVVISRGLNNLFGFNIIAISLTVICVGTAMAIWGFDSLLLLFRILFWISLPLYIVLTAAIIWGIIPKNGPAHPEFTWLAFAAEFAAGVSYNLTFAPLVSDYTRYLPKGKSRLLLLCNIYFGAALSAIWLIILGAWLATYFGAQDSLAVLKQVGNIIYPGLGAAMVIIAVCALTATVGTNTYSGMLTIITAADSFTRVRLSRRARLLGILIIAAVSLEISLFENGPANEAIYNSLSIMLYLLVPWTAVNLTDYFVVRRGVYEIQSLLEPDGIYRAWDKRGLVAYAAGFLASVPFFSLSRIYLGPVARMLGGVDISWAPGLLVASLSYYAMTRTHQTLSR